MTGSFAYFTQRSAFVFTIIMLLGCAGSAARSTRLRASDFEVTTQKMAASLAASDFLADRSADSPPITIVINRVENLTGDVITLAEQWMLVARVRNSLPVEEMAHNKQIRFVISPERHAMLREAGFEDDLGTYQTPTHVMKATFLSSRRAARAKGGERLTNLRSDFYYLEYAITDLSGRNIEWSDRFEFQREARGTLFD